jgi:hypothetical protein
MVDILMPGYIKMKL